jgi:hypothetical protein
VEPPACVKPHGSLGLGICSGILLVNRFIIDIPDWLAIVLIVVAVIPLMFMGFFALLGK